MLHLSPVRSIFDIMELTVEENTPGLMIFIDFQKAFDSLEWNYLLRLHSLCILQGGAEDFRGGSQIFRAKKGGI